MGPLGVPILGGYPSFPLNPGNLLTAPYAFDSAAWTKNAGSITPNATVAPDGSGSADLFVEDTANAAHAVEASAAGLPALTAYTFRTFVKTAGRRWIYFTAYNTASPTSDEAWFDLQTGALGTVQANVAASIQAIPNGWHRITARLTTDADGGSLSFGVRSATADNSAANFVGSGAAAFYLWGAEFFPS